MPDFLKLVSPAEAWSILMDHMPSIVAELEEVAVTQALNRVTARAVYANEPLPAFTRSTMDGFAVIAADTYGARENLPVYLRLVGEVVMGCEPEFVISSTEAALIHTGGMIPKGANAVVMVENTQYIEKGEVEIHRAVAPGENIILVGEDVSPGQEVIPAGVRIRPAEIGGLMALGQTRVIVAQYPKVGIISTGNEVILPEEKPQAGQVRDVNTYTLSALVEQAGGQAITYGIFPDKMDMIQEALHIALNECQIVIITAGSSASGRDLTADVIQSQGKPGVLVHGINIRPGKPSILAVCNGKAVIGLPGNPISALVIAGLFVVPLIQYVTGLKRYLPPSLTATLANNLPSQAGREEWIPVRIIASGSGYIAEPIFFKSNLIFNLVSADGLVHIPPDATGLNAGEMVKVVLVQ